MQLHPKKSLVEHLGHINDPRVNRTKEHPLINVLLIALCTLLCGGETFNEVPQLLRALELSDYIVTRPKTWRPCGALP